MRVDKADDTKTEIAIKKIIDFMKILTVQNGGGSMVHMLPHIKTSVVYYC
jgi:hypothetical protein